MANADSAGADRGAAGASEAADLAVPRLSSPSSLAVLEIRCSDGAYTVMSPPEMRPDLAMPMDMTPNVKIMRYSNDGSIFAWNNGGRVNAVNTATGSLTQHFPRPKCVAIAISPLNTQLATWENYSVKNGARDGQGGGAPNVVIWSMETGEKVHAWINRTHDNWEPQWSSDEKYCLRCVSNEVHFYDASDYTKGVVKKCVVKGLSQFRLAPRGGPCTLAVFVPSIKGAPASVRLYHESNFERPLCNKSFFKAEKISICWNKQGTACLVSSATETDTTGKSYYGETNLYYLSVKDGMSAHVQLDKEGPIYNFDWSPCGTVFAVVYGFMPAKVVLFDSKCDKVFDFGTGPRSVVQFSPHGNIILLAGFGNLRGEVQFWDRKTFKMINLIHAEDTTAFEWCPDSEHLVTASCSPRLKVDNGFKVWHYAKGLVYKKDIKELWSVAWQPVPDGTFSEKPIAKVDAKASAAAVATKTVYRPPGARGTESTIKLHHNQPAENAEPAAPLSKAALKNKKKREAKQRAAEKAALAETGIALRKPSAEQKAAVAMIAEHEAHAAAKSAASDPVKDLENKIRNLTKKLRQIDVLVQRQEAGEFLQENQKEKIADRPRVQHEIDSLSIKLEALNSTT